MAYDILTSISQDADERARFRARRKFQMDMAHDRIVSFEEGVIKGRTDRELEVARNLLTRGDPPDTVSQVTGLPMEKIQELMMGLTSPESPS
jgi:hypothetical protein